MKFLKLILVVLFSSQLALSNTVYAGTEGGGPVMLNQMVLNQQTISPDSLIIDDAFISQVAFEMAQFDEVKTEVVLQAFDPSIVATLKGFSASFGQESQESNESVSDLVAKAVEASVLTVYGGFEQNEAIEAVVYEPEYSAVEFQNLMGVGFN